MSVSASQISCLRTPSLENKAKNEGRLLGGWRTHTDSPQPPSPQSISWSSKLSSMAMEEKKGERKL